MYIPTVNVICVNVPYRPIAFFLVDKTLYIVVDDTLESSSTSCFCNMKPFYGPY